MTSIKFMDKTGQTIDLGDRIQVELGPGGPKLTGVIAGMIGLHPSSGTQPKIIFRAHSSRRHSHVHGVRKEDGMEFPTVFLLERSIYS